MPDPFNLDPESPTDAAILYLILLAEATKQITESQAIIIANMQPDEYRQVRERIVTKAGTRLRAFFRRLGT